jgi:hypothetical protein
MGPAHESAITGTSTQSIAAATATCFALRIIPTVDCYVAIGLNPVATSASTRMVANQVEYYAATVGYKVAALKVGLLDGVMNITELV